MALEDATEEETTEEETPVADDAGDGEESKSEETPEADEEDEGWKPTTPSEKRLHAANKKKNRENQTLRERVTKADADAAELEALRDEKRTKEEKAEAKATKASESASATAAENEKLRIMLACGIDEDDDDTFDDIKIKGDNAAERKASAIAFATKYKLGKFAVAEDGKPSKTPGSANLKGGLKPNDDKDTEMDPAKLAARIPRGF